MSPETNPTPAEPAPAPELITKVPTFAEPTQPVETTVFETPDTSEADAAIQAANLEAGEKVDALKASRIPLISPESESENKMIVLGQNFESISQPKPASEAVGLTSEASTSIPETSSEDKNQGFRKKIMSFFTRNHSKEQEHTDS